MSARFCGLAAACALLICTRLVCAQAPAVDDHHGMPGLEPFIDGLVASATLARNVAGVQVAVVKDGAVLLEKGYGIAALNPQRAVDPQRSLFRLGSISKTFTWLALMQLAAQNKLALTDPVNAHLPRALAVPDDGFTQPVRVLDLMNHTAGFEDVLQVHELRDDSQLRTASAQVQRYRPARVYAPGRLLSYSNYGALLAGQIIAHVSGMEFESYVEREILAPLGLTHTTFREGYDASAPKGLPAPLAASWLADRAEGIEWRDGAYQSFPPAHLLHVASAGSAVSTAGDMARYMLAWLDAERLERAGVLKRSAYEQFQRVSFRAAAGLRGVHHGFFDAPGQRTVVGLPTLWHNGATDHHHADLTLFPTPLCASCRTTTRPRDDSS